MLIIVMGTYKIKLYGEPPFALTYDNKFVELSSLRPNPKNHLSKNKSYNSRIKFDKINLGKGLEIMIPICFTIGDRRYVKVT